MQFHVGTRCAAHREAGGEPFGDQAQVILILHVCTGHPNAGLSWPGKSWYVNNAQKTAWLLIPFLNSHVVPERRQPHVFPVQGSARR